MPVRSIPRRQSAAGYDGRAGPPRRGRVLARVRAVAFLAAALRAPADEQDDFDDYADRVIGILGDELYGRRAR